MVSEQQDVVKRVRVSGRAGYRASIRYAVGDRGTGMMVSVKMARDTASEMGGGEDAEYRESPNGGFAVRRFQDL